MKRKIIVSLLLLFLASAAGALTATLYMANTTAMLNRLVRLHQIEDLRQNLIISIQAVQSSLYTVNTRLGQKIDTIAGNVDTLNAAAAACTTCHHAPGTVRRIEGARSISEEYQRALSYYITASANRDRIDKLKTDAAHIGNELLQRTTSMSVDAGRKLEAMTVSAMQRIGNARLILLITMAATLLFGILTAAHLIKAVTKPVNTLVNATRELAAGNLGHTITLEDRTEFEELAANFNAMSIALNKSYAAITREIEERRQAEEALRESEERYALAAQGANDGLWDWDIRKNAVHYSGRWKAMLGYGEDEFGSAPEDWLRRVHPDDRAQLEAKLAAHLISPGPHFECEYRIRHRDGSYRWVLNRGLAVRDGSGTACRVAGSQTDISDRKAAEAQLLHDAFHDALTGLPNRALFLDRLGHDIAGAKRHPDYLYAVLFMDLDRFKVINDSLGHDIGDKLLVAVAQRLTSCLRPGDTIARLGGDEFAVLLEDITDVANAEEITCRIEQVLSAPYFIEGHEIVTTQSIGVTVKTPLYLRAEQIMRDADIAMYEAKSKGRARHEFYDTAMHAGIIARLKLESDLRIAVEHRKGFVLHYQPIIDLMNRRLIGFEALVRWMHPLRGLISPLEFIPLAEESGMIFPLSEWIIREACRQIRAWQQQYPAQPRLRMSVNISGRQLAQPGFADSLAAILRDETLEPGSLAIEVTESMIMENTDTAMRTLTRLQMMGVHIHIDDFGTGYSSLSYLHRFPVNALKIDRSFISKLSADHENEEIVRTIIALARHLDLEVIAEGIEQDDQLSAIKGLACGLGQGFLFSRPLPADAMEAWIRSDMAITA